MSINCALDSAPTPHLTSPTRGEGFKVNELRIIIPSPSMGEG